MELELEVIKLCMIFVQQVNNFFFFFNYFFLFWACFLDKGGYGYQNFHHQHIEGAGEQMVKRTPLLVRKCADGVAVSICYDVTGVWI